jgi:hypothetical protein
MPSCRPPDGWKTKSQVIDRLPYIFPAPPSISSPWLLRFFGLGENTSHGQGLCHNTHKSIWGFFIIKTQEKGMEKIMYGKNNSPIRTGRSAVHVFRLMEIEVGW